MSEGTTNNKCYLCRFIGYILAAIVLSMILRAILPDEPGFWSWIFAILVFLALFLAGVWAVRKLCNSMFGNVAVGAAGIGAAGLGASHASGASTDSSDGAGFDAAQDREAEARRAAANAEADARLAEEQAKDAEAAAAKAQADADAKAAAERAAAEKAEAEAKEAAARKAAEDKAKAEKAAADKKAADAKAAAEKAEADAKAAEAKAKADAKAAADAEKAAAAKAAADAKAKDSKAKKADSAANQDFDGDGVVEGKNEGTRPAQLKAARGGKADDLKMIKGIGPKMEKLCNKLGFYHFDQIAAWSKDEVAWVDANLEGFHGRVTRDEWVKQAKILAQGGETEFSKRVEDGGVY